MICISVHTFLLLPDNRVRTHSDQAARVAITSPEIIWSIYRLPLGGWVSVRGLLFVCIFIKDLLCLMIWEEKLVLRNKIRNFYIHYSSFCQKIFLISVSNERVLNRTVMDGWWKVASTLHHSIFQLKLILMNNDILCQGLSTLPTSDYLYDYSILALILWWVNCFYSSQYLCQNWRTIVKNQLSIYTPAVQLFIM